MTRPVLAPRSTATDALLNGFKAAFLPSHQRQDYVRRMALELSRYHEDGTIAPEAWPVEDQPKGSPYPARV